VKPRINESGLVAMEVSSFTRQNVLGTDQFVFTKRGATANLVAQDGETIAIGGLIQDNIEKTSTGIPYLNQIPILGYLFGSHDDKRTKTEIIVLLTPHVVKNQKEAAGMTTDYINRLKRDNKNLKIDQYNIEPSSKKPRTEEKGL
jgi:general secretion pathway protein D